MAFARISMNSSPLRSTGDTKVVWHSGAIRRWVSRDPTIQREVESSANRVKDKAIEIYNSQQRHTTSYTIDRGASPAPGAEDRAPGKRGTKYAQYEDSFQVIAGRTGPGRTGEGEAGAALVTNKDATANWVEHGAHAGGVTPVLAYRPLFQAVDALTDGVVETAGGVTPWSGSSKTTSLGSTRIPFGQLTSALRRGMGMTA